MMQEERYIELLSRVQKVDAPPFLFTRIQSKIEGVANNYLPLSWALSGTFLLLVLLSLNIFSSVQKSDNDKTDLSYSVSLNQSNQLYNE